ncbi:MAG TPA: competence protein ComEA [Gammaproteobacteria bacterium]|jgi:competence protein ComEA|nr:competence protein ComEA [Gammaproteobacteria bacterium]
MYLSKLHPLHGALIAALIAFGQPASAEPVDINQADAPSLAENIVGVGPVLAGAIVSYRTENGAFRSVEELLEVPGIGPKVLENNEETLLVDGKAYQN